MVWRVGVVGDFAGCFAGSGRDGVDSDGVMLFLEGCEVLLFIQSLETHLYLQL